MSENSEFDRTAAEADDVVVEGEGAEGKYVEGDYGSAGVAGEKSLVAEEGEYPAGDYGTGGVAGASAVEEEAGEYTEGDYGNAGAIGETSQAARETKAAAPEGEYPEGDYGTAGEKR